MECAISFGKQLSLLDGILTLFQVADMSVDLIKCKKILDPVLFLVFCALVGTALRLMISPDHIAAFFHPLLGVLFVAMGIVHLILNKSWIVTVLSGGRLGPVGVGLGLGILLLLAFLLFPMGTVPGHGH